MMKRYFLPAAAVVLSAAPCAAQTAYTHFEARHTHPIGLTPDGSRLFAVNSPDARLSVFDVSNPANPVPLLIAEIPVGLEPVAAEARTDDEIWVVNELSDSVSVVSLAKGCVVATLSVPDEPADVVFAGGKAFVSCSADNLVKVFDAVTRAPAGEIPLKGLQPRALTVSADGSKVYAAFLHSGNGTTILPADKAPPQPAPTRPSLPPPPYTGLIVPANDARIPYTVLDHDIAEISAADQTVIRYFDGAGTNHFDIAQHPVTGELWSANTEARNLTRFEPALRGHFIDNRITRVSLTNGAAVAVDLNPGLNYATLPNHAAAALALAQPSALAMLPDGSGAWVAAFGSDRLARLDNTGAVLARVDLRSAGEGARRMRGPRGLALSADGARLFVLNKLSNSLTVVDAAATVVVQEVSVGSHDPMPAAAREGRGFLFDARLSGNGTASCASCHLDADRDGLAWDLGDPGGVMVTVKGANLSAHQTALRDRVLHPMKGPMTTQTLIGMAGNLGTVTTPAAAVTPKFHWRGDRPDLQSFNPTYDKLMGGPEISAADMDALAAYLMTLRHHPNPNRNPDRTLPVSFRGGNAVNGRDLFNNHLASHCITCHALPSGTDNNIDLLNEVGGAQPMKNPPLRTIYRRAFLNPKAGAESLTGFGLGSDGSGFELPIVHPYNLSELSTAAEFADVTAFLLCFDTGTAPSVGRALTLTSAPAAGSAGEAELALLEARAAAADNDLVARGRVGGESRGFLWDKTAQRYRPDTAAESFMTRGALLAGMSAGDHLTFLAVPPGSGALFARDRDADGTPDADEPRPSPDIVGAPAGAVTLTWPAGQSDWFAEWTAELTNASWLPLNTPAAATAPRVEITDPAAAPRRFYRLRRTW